MDLGVEFHYFTISISPGSQVLSSQGFNGPHIRRIVNQLFPGMVSSQFFSLPFGALGPVEETVGGTKNMKERTD